MKNKIDTKNKQKKVSAKKIAEPKLVSVKDIIMNCPDAKFKVLLNDGSELDHVTEVSMKRIYSGTLFTIEVLIESPTPAKDE